MYAHSKPILAALATTALLAIVVGAASAARLSTNERNFEQIWNETLGTAKTKLRFTAGGQTVSCRVTLLGRYVEHTIRKETGIRQSTVNQGELESCANGTATLRTETMPWEGRYRSFSGTLPATRGIVSGSNTFTVRIREAGGLECEAASEVNHPVVTITGNSAEAPETGFETTGEPENITAEKNNGIPLRGEGFLCAFAGEGRLEGIGIIRNLPRTAKLRITLI